MKRVLLIPLLLLPLFAGAAPVPTTTASTSTYVADSNVDISQPLPGDLVTAGGSVDVVAPVDGDVIAIGGAVSVAQGAHGDVRVAGGKVSVGGTVDGDIAAAAGTIRIRGSAAGIYAAGGAVDIQATSTGDVTVYGANVLLSGDYGGNVTVVASNRLALNPGTHVHGQLRYSAPQELSVPQSVQLDGGARYTGAYAYVPTSQQVHQFALIGSALFFAVRVLAGMIVAGLIAGLFPMLVERIAVILLVRNSKRVSLVLLTGILVTVFTPLLCLFLLLSFVGAELALLLLVSYLFLGLVAYAFTGVLAGVLLRRTVLLRLQGHDEFSWQDAAIGTAVVHLIGLVPYLGTPLVILMALSSAGALCWCLYQTAFSRI
jgi:cytoskeletal protein CcmA (bactofilin family)